jgi:SAM-dependent methyltransferase
MTQDVTWSDAMPEVYDRCLGPVIFAPYAERLALQARDLNPRRVLEIAAGSGIVTKELVAALPAADITATDLSPGMVEYGARQAPGARWRQADAQQLPFDDGSVDLVVCQFGVMFFPDRIGAYAEMARVLAPGGGALITVWDVVEATDVAAAFMQAWNELFPDDPPTFLVRIPHGYTDPDQISSDLEAGGLDVVALDRVVETTSAVSAASVAEGYCQGTPMRFILEQKGSLDDITARVAESMTRQLGEGAITGEMAAYVITARKP